LPSVTQTLQTATWRVGAAARPSPLGHSRAVASLLRLRHWLFAARSHVATFRRREVDCYRCAAPASLVALSLPGLIATDKPNPGHYRCPQRNRPRSAIPVCLRKAGAAELAAPSFPSTVVGGDWLSLQTSCVRWGLAQLAAEVDGPISEGLSPAAVVARFAKPSLASIVLLPLVWHPGERGSLVAHRPPLTRNALCGPLESATFKRTE